MKNLKEKIKQMFVKLERESQSDSQMVEAILSLFKQQMKGLVGEERRHITDTKGIKNKGKTKWDKIANEVQKDIDAQNQLREEILQNIESL